MDPRASLSLFSRGATPPPKVNPSRSPEESQPLPPPPQHRPETQEVSHHQPQPSPVHDIDALLRGLSTNAQSPSSATQPPTQPPPQPSSKTQLPDTTSTNQTNLTESHTEKQNALLHNLMNPSGYSSQAPQAPQAPQVPQAPQAPQAPQSSQASQTTQATQTTQASQAQADQMQRVNPSPQGSVNESQGKQLLEQLMAGCVL